MLIVEFKVGATGCLIRLLLVRQWLVKYLIRDFCHSCFWGVLQNFVVQITVKNSASASTAVCTVWLLLYRWVFWQSLNYFTSHFSADCHCSVHSQMYHTQHLLLTHADCLLCLQIHTVCSLHLFSQCTRLSFYSPFLFPFNVCAEVLLFRFKVYLDGLASVRGLLTVPRVCVCAYSDDTLSFCSWDHGSVHGACVDRTRRVRAVRRNLQRMHFCCGASTKLMGILGSTFRTSQVWHQKAYYSHKFVLLVWIWWTGLLVCASS